jgi:hypothetical protein
MRFTRFDTGHSRSALSAADRSTSSPGDPLNRPHIAVHPSPARSFTGSYPENLSVTKVASEKLHSPCNEPPRSREQL